MIRRHWESALSASHALEGLAEAIKSGADVSLMAELRAVVVDEPFNGVAGTVNCDTCLADPMSTSSWPPGRPGIFRVPGCSDVR